MSFQMKIEMLDPATLVPYDKNAKKHTPEQIASLAKVITEHGWDQPIVVDKNLCIIKGHGRTLAGIKLGLKKVPVVIRHDLTKAQVKAARLADNRVALGEFDTELLQSELKELMDLEVDLSGLGFNEKELSFLTEDLGMLDMTSALENLNREVNKQAEKARETVQNIDVSEVPVRDALGFKAVPGEAVRRIGRFMALVETRSSKKGAAAFIDFIDSILAVEAAA